MLPAPEKMSSALLPVHERLGFVEVRAGGPVADGEAVAAAVVGDPEHAPGPAGDLGHVVVPEVVEDLVQGRADRGHARELLDEGVPQVDGLLGTAQGCRSGQRAGRVWTLPSSSSYSSWRFTGNACIR